MLVNLVEILKLAEEKNCAVGAFNTPNLECLNAVIAAAEKLDVPVIISHAQLHEGVSPIATIGPIMLEAAKAAKVPVCVHLDHCESLEYMAQALEIGFTGVMYDGSTLPYAENLENTKKAVQEKGIEAEIEYITDFSVIAGYGIMSTPALMIDGKVVSTGRVLNEKQIEKLL